MERMQRLHQRPTSLIAKALLVVALVGMIMGCYGRFQMTRTVYKYNGNVGDDFRNSTVGAVTQQVAFWLFVPVYGVTMLGDAVILNLIDFWTGSPIDIAYQERLDDGTVVTLTPAPGGQEAELAYSKDGRVLATHRIVRVSQDVCELRDTDGGLLGTAVRNSVGDGS